jgi:lysophospholipase L1-like esterase
MLVLARKLAVVLASTLAGALIAELYLRAFVDNPYRLPIVWDAHGGEPTLVHRSSRTPGLDYELTPNVDVDAGGFRVKVNSLGMRGGEVELAKSPSTRRIVVVGDSVAFGLHVDNDSTFSSRLESLLDADGKSAARGFDVLNLSVPGYSSKDEAIVVRCKALALAPDLLIVGYYLNDPEDEPLQRLHSYFHERALWEHSHLLRFIGWKRRSWRLEHYGHGDEFRYLHADPERWRSVVDAFDDIAAATRERGVEVLLAVLPTLYGCVPADAPATSEPSSNAPAGSGRASKAAVWSRWEDYPYRDIHAQVVAQASRAGFGTIDLLDAWAASGHAPAELMADPEHPNALGHALLARALFERIAAPRAPASIVEERAREPR